MATTLKYWREAATLMLVTRRQPSKGVVFKPVNSSNNANKNTMRGDNLDVLLLKRSSKSKFMPSLYVFPGGVASDADFSEDWKKIFFRSNSDLAKNTFKYAQKAEMSPPMFSRERDFQFSSIPPQIAFRICAIRETFEESGVLLARNVQDLKSIDNEFMMKNPVKGSPIQKEGDILDYWRKQVYADASKFIDMCYELNIVPDVWCLFEWSNWLTPADYVSNSKKLRRRFDTAFFLVCVPEKPDAMHDEGETVHLQWGSPPHVINEYVKSNAQIAPPQLYELSRLLNFNNLSDLHQFVWKREIQGIQRYFPVGLKCQDAYLSLLPGDDLYPKKPDEENGENLEMKEESLAELNAKFPNVHRTYLIDHHYKIACNIDMVGGHVRPLSDLSNTNCDTNTQTFNTKL